MDIEIFKFQIIKEKFQNKYLTWKKSMLQPISVFKKYKIYNYKLTDNFSKLRLTIDTKRDFILIKQLLQRLNYNF